MCNEATIKLWWYVYVPPDGLNAVPANIIEWDRAKGRQWIQEILKSYCMKLFVFYTFGFDFAD